MSSLRDEMSRGNLAAAVMFAVMYGRSAGLSDEDVDEVVADVEAKINEDDAEAHWELYRAYDMLRGKTAPEEKRGRAFDHLVAAARFGDDPHDAMAVANHYHHGSVAVKPDIAQAVYWYQKAEERGSDEASVLLAAIRKKNPLL